MITRPSFWASLKPTAFKDFLRRSGDNPDLELLDGTAVERMPAHAEHERLRLWLRDLLSAYLRSNRRGTLYDASVAVEISPTRGRRPDLFFVSNERRSLVQKNAAYGAPDLVIEVISTYDLRTDPSSRERDYSSILVPEILFLDPVKRQARILRLHDGDYEIEILLPGGTLRLQTLDGLSLPTDWLLNEPRPEVSEALARLSRPMAYAV